MSDDILSQSDGDVLTITLNRPDDGNAMSDANAAELAAMLDDAADQARIAVLRGAGADFCIGRSRTGRPPADAQTEALARRRQTEVIFNCYGAFRRCTIPVIGVVQGRALGFGCSMAALCDITLAGDKASFQVPEMAHNILPTMVMSSFIDRVSPKALKYLVYSTATIGPERALSFGIVSEVVAAAELDAATDTLIEAMLRSPRAALEGAKEYLRVAADMATPGAVDFARNLHATINSSSELKK